MKEQKKKDTLDISKGLFIEKPGRPDRILAAVTLLLAAFGTVMIFSAGYAYAEAKYNDPWYFISRQAIWLTIGIFAMLLASRIKISFYKAAAIPIYAVSLLLLLLTLVIGFVGNGAQRWISIGPLTIQPSEIAKFAVVIMLAYYFDKNGDRATEIKSGRTAFLHGTLFPMLILIAPIILIMLQRHLSCIIILGCIGIVLTLLSGINMKYIVGVIAAGGIGVSCIALFTDYTKDRLTVWLDPEKYKLTGGWQTLQGLMAIGSGGIFGKGLGMGELKYCYVSEPANDMIFAILCEELGFIGAAATILLFALLIYRGFKIAIRSSDVFSKMLCLGISTQIAIQALLNIAVVTNTIPNTGISLPFFSYGGSSLIMLLFEVGIMLSVSRDATIQK